MIRFVAFVVASSLAACTHARVGARPMSNPKPEASSVVPGDGLPEIAGRWTEPLDPFSIQQLAATRDAVFVAGHVGARPEIRVARLVGGALRVEPFRPVPFPPASVLPTPSWEDAGGVDAVIALDETRSPPQLAVNRREYQGGSWGLAVFPSLAAASHEEIETPTGESDIAFGKPIVLRGDDLFTNDAETLRHYHRVNGRWTPTKLAVESSWWSLAASADGAIVVASTLDSTERLRTGKGAPEDDPATIVVLSRAADGSYARASARALPAHVSGLAFAGRTLVVSFIRPAPDGTGVWTFEPPYREPAKKIAVPPTHYEGATVAANELDAAGRFAVTATSVLYAIDLEAGKVACRLRMPERRRRAPGPIVTVWGTHAVAAVDDRLGIYDLSVCRESSAP